MRYFFSDKIDPGDEVLLIDGPDARHIKNVLRMRPGQLIGVFDGKGMEYRAAIEALGPKGVEVRIVDAQPSATESPVAITVAQAILKDRKMDRIVRQLTELGVFSWLPYTSHYAIAKLDRHKMSARSERWKRLSREALKQCRRGRVMEIQTTASFSEMLDKGKDHDVRVVFYEEETAALPGRSALQHAGPIGRIFAAIGPEGGFSTAEIEAARAAGFVIAGLGPRILRADTAAVAAVSLLQYLYGDLGEKDLDKSTVIE